MGEESSFYKKRVKKYAVFRLAKQKLFRKNKTVGFSFCLFNNLMFIKVGEIAGSEEQASDLFTYPDQQPSESEETAKRPQRCNC